ncbi:hypothetical protein BLNAU_7090 [Blattamonas nauphoetae]|uniref:Uncharacterized protein n=1 Tax=Blattamonas nauphoetae TaxID=2049346 RepID=A0ABQ9Y2F2_9EUKA|nr:hypothetical protein BLNAU_7090 [Blattamonas nauphoetae]
MLKTLIMFCSVKHLYLLVQANLIPQLIITLNPQSLSFAEAVDIHTCLIQLLSSSLWLATPAGRARLGIEDNDDKQAFHETLLKQVVAPSENYIRHLCVNRFSIIDERQMSNFLHLLGEIVQIGPHYQTAMDSVLSLPVFTIPSCLPSIENDLSILYFLHLLIRSQKEWNGKDENVRLSGTTLLGSLRMEGMDDVLDQRMQHSQTGDYGEDIQRYSMEWNTLQGLNIQELC